jgi:multidrug transporter EmrE-like cation transporter
MKSNSLATIGVMFSASTILLLSALGYFVFKEQFGIREALGVFLAILAVVVMNPK